MFYITFDVSRSSISINHSDLAVEDKDFVQPTKKLRISSPNFINMKSEIKMPIQEASNLSESPEKIQTKHRNADKFQSFWTNSKHLKLKDESDNEFPKQRNS